MDMSGDGMSCAGDFQKQSGQRHIVNIQGPFFQRNPGDSSNDSQKNLPAPTIDLNTTVYNSPLHGNVIGRRTQPRASIASNDPRIIADTSLLGRSEQPVIFHRQQVTQPSKNLVDEVEDEEEDDDGDVDASVCVSNNEQTGRWTRKEHEVFLEALKKFGKEWKKVASMVKTRTVVQTRTHAQKYFQKVSKSGGGEDSENEQEAVEEIAASKVAPLISDRNIASSDSSSSPSKGNTSPKHLRRGPSQEYEGYGKIEKQDNSTGRGNAYDYYPCKIPYPDQYSTSKEFMDRKSSPPLTGKRKHIEVSESELSHSAANINASRAKTSSHIPNSGSSSGIGRNWDYTYPYTVSDGKRMERSDRYEESKPKLLPLSLSCESLMDMEGKGAQVLFMMKEMNETSLNTPKDNQLSNQPCSIPKINQSKAFGSIPLKIANPDSVPHTHGAYSDNQDGPDTPWESEVRALEAKIAFEPKTVSSGDRDSEISDSPHTSRFTTPSEQKDFLKKIMMTLDMGFEGLSSLEALLTSAVENNGDGSGIEDLGSALVNLSRALNRTDPAGCTALMHACSPSPTDYEEDDEDEEAEESNTFGADQNFVLASCSLLMKYGASPAACDVTGTTCLHRVAFLGHSVVGELLICGGCPVDAVNKDGDAAIHIAAREGHGIFLEMLSSVGANCHLRSAQSRGALDLIPCTPHSTREELRTTFLTAEPRLRTLILHHDDCVDRPHINASAWESGDRVEHIINILRDPTQFKEHELEFSNEFKKAGVDLLGKIHSPAYIASVDALSRKAKESELKHENKKDTTKDTTKDDDKNKMDVESGCDITQGTFGKSEHTDDVERIENSEPSFPSGTLQSARRATGSVTHAIDRVLSGKNRNAFCVVRPPGHHAGYDGFFNPRSSGFCVFNSVAAGALHALDEEGHGVQRVAIIDLDIHHGRGTEDIVRRYPHPSRLFLFCLHLFDSDPASISPAKQSTSHDKINVESDADVGLGSTHGGDVSVSTTAHQGYTFYPGSGLADDTTHNIINVPLQPLWRSSSSSGTASDGEGCEGQSGPLLGRLAYRKAIAQRLVPALRAFSPGLILISAGFDAALGDVGNSRRVVGPSGIMEDTPGMDLGPEDFEWVTTEISRIADLCCSGRVVSVLEGGYGSRVILDRKAPAYVPSDSHTDISMECSKELEPDSMEANHHTHSEESDAPLNTSAAIQASSVSEEISEHAQEERELNVATRTTEALTAVSSTGSINGSFGKAPNTPSACGQNSGPCSIDRGLLAMSVAAHVRRLVDAYGPASVLSTTLSAIPTALSSPSSSSSSSCSSFPLHPPSCGVTSQSAPLTAPTRPTEIALAPPLSVPPPVQLTAVDVLGNSDVAEVASLLHPQQAPHDKIDNTCESNNIYNLSRDNKPT